MLLCWLLICFILHLRSELWCSMKWEKWFRRHDNSVNLTDWSGHGSRNNRLKFCTVYSLGSILVFFLAQPRCRNCDHIMQIFIHFGARCKGNHWNLTSCQRKLPAAIKSWRNVTLIDLLKESINSSQWLKHRFNGKKIGDQNYLILYKRQDVFLRRDKYFSRDDIHWKWCLWRHAGNFNNYLIFITMKTGNFHEILKENKFFKRRRQQINNCFSITQVDKKLLLWSSC